MIIMLRSIADIARSEGEDLSDPESALSCVQVFAQQAGLELLFEPQQHCVQVKHREA